MLEIESKLNNLILRMGKNVLSNETIIELLEESILHGEYGLVLEGLIFVMDQKNKELKYAFKDEIIDLSRLMKLDSNLINDMFFDSNI